MQLTAQAVGSRPTTLRTSPGGAKETALRLNIGRMRTKSEAASRVPRFSRPLREAGTCADINRNREGETRKGATPVVSPP